MALTKEDRIYLRKKVKKSTKEIRQLLKSIDKESLTDHPSPGIIVRTLDKIRKETINIQKVY